MSRKALFLIMVLLAGCGPAVNPEEAHGPACQSEVCWDLSNVSSLMINDFPLPDQLVPDEVHGWRFSTTVGHTYTVRVKVSSGTSHTYVSSSVIIDPSNNELTDYYSDTGITFTALDGDYFIAIQDTGNVLGSDYTVRIISYDENLDPLPGTINLLVNDEPKSFKLVPDEIVRFMFNGIRGGDYTIKVTVISGQTDTFLSLIPSVDDEAYELADFYSNDGIRFRAAQTAIYFIAVEHRGSPIGSDYTIQVTSP